MWMDIHANIHAKALIDLVMKRDWGVVIVLFAIRNIRGQADVPIDALSWLVTNFYR